MKLHMCRQRSRSPPPTASGPNVHFDIAHIESTMGKKKMVILVFLYLIITNDTE